MVTLPRSFSLMLLIHGLYRHHGGGVKPFRALSLSEDEDGGYWPHVVFPPSLGGYNVHFVEVGVGEGREFHRLL